MYLIKYVSTVNFLMFSVAGTYQSRRHFVRKVLVHFTFTLSQLRLHLFSCKIVTKLHIVVIGWRRYTYNSSTNVWFHHRLSNHTPKWLRVININICSSLESFCGQMSPIVFTLVVGGGGEFTKYFIFRPKESVLEKISFWPPMWLIEN